MRISLTLRRTAVALGAFVVLVTAACGESPSSFDDGPGDDVVYSDAGFDQGQLAEFRSALTKWNGGSYTFRLAALAGRGSTRCGLGYSAAFPELVLLTVINTDGRWFQASIDPQAGVRSETMVGGADYNSAFANGNQNVEAFFAGTEPCTVASGGAVQLAASAAAGS